MRFRNPKTGTITADALTMWDEHCTGNGCAKCPLHQVAEGDNDAGCESFVASNPIAAAELIGWEVIADDSCEAAKLKAAPAVKADMVNSPSHYRQGDIECIDALTAMITPYGDPNDAALSWQVVKYIWRHPFKFNPLEDLKKAQWYLNRLIAHYEKKEVSDVQT